jgi:tellurite resistance protein TehA-like permease
MSTRVIAGIVSLCVVVTGLFLANMFLTMMIGEINRKRQDGSLVSYFAFTFPKMLRIFDEYRSSYPNGNMHIYALAAFAFAIIGLIGVGLSLHVIG